MDKLRVLVVDDKVVERKAAADAVEASDMARVAHVASNSAIAMEWLEQGDIDVMLLSRRLIEKDGQDLVETILGRYSGLNIIVTAESETSADPLIREALRQGAFDCVVRDGMKKSLNTCFSDIMVKKYTSQAGESTKNSEGCREARPKTHTGRPELIVIASSTGGPSALETVLSKLPGAFPVPVLVIQHMPPGFTGMFASSMNKKCALRVTEAGEGDLVTPGRVLIAPGGMHMALERLEDERVAVRLSDLPPENGVKPSADILFTSAAEVFKERNILAVVLTGMGSDGVKGVLEMKRRCSCYCITQDEGSCIVYGMPRCVSDAGLSDESADIGDIADRICHIAYNGVEYHEL